MKGFDMSIDIREAHPSMRDDTAHALAPAIRAGLTHATLDTHWSRILNYDLFSADSDGTSEPPVAPSVREKRVSFAQFARSPLRATATALGAYAALHLAVGGLLHVLNAPEAAAAFVPMRAHAAADSKHAHASGGSEAR
jgi:hypothetical protein